MNHNDIQLIGQRVLIQLDAHPSHTTTSSGLLVPQYDVVTTEGGRLKSQLSENRYLSVGTILQISPDAAKSTEASTLTTGQKVYVNPSAVSPHYQFFLDRSSLVLDFTGLISVPPQLIEAYVISDARTTS